MTSSLITCLACGHVDGVENNTGLDDTAFFEMNVFKCSECAARMRYGTLAPCTAVEPYVDDRGRQHVRHRIQDPITREDIYVFDLDPEHAAMLAKAGLSLVIP